MRPEENIEKLIKSLHFKASAEMHERTLNDVLDAHGESKKTEPAEVQPHLWRIIMKSKITKLAAAVIVIVVILALHNGSVDITRPAFGLEDVIAATRKAQWMHMTWEFTAVNIDPNEAKEELKESWISVNPRRSIQIYKNGSISIAELVDFTDEVKTQHYDAQTNLVKTIWRCTGVDTISPPNIVDMYLEEISHLESRGVKVEYSDTLYDGQPAKTINITDTDGSSSSKRWREFSIVADVETYLPKRLIIHISDSLGRGTRANVTFDYPESGPTDIYQAGAPRNAKVKVIDHRPSTEFREAIKPYREARENIPLQRITIDVENENDTRYRVCIIYTDGRKERFEQLMWVRNDAPPATDDFDRILDWAHDAKSDELGIQVYDGEYVYRVERDYRDRWTSYKQYCPSRKPSYVVGGLIHRGWPRIRKGKPVENNYAAENNLLCIETWHGPNFKDNKLVEPAEKTLYYIDPEHDYVCVRQESFRHLVVPHSNPAIDELPFDPNDTPSNPYSVTEVTKFGLTDAGQWYPSEIITKRQSWREHGGGWESWEERLVVRLYVETSPQFTGDVFQPTSLPDINE